VAAKQQINLDTGGRRFRYYLAWITKLPPGKQTAEINELTLYQCGAEHCTTSPAANGGPAAGIGAIHLGTTGG
jgi:hypothetical protein